MSTGFGDRAGDWLIKGLCGLACLVALATMFDIAYKVITGAHLAISAFGLHFLTDSQWKPNFDRFGAGTLVYGTAVTTGMALALAVPIGVSIGLFLSLLAPQRLRGVIGPLVEMVPPIPGGVPGPRGLLLPPP